MPDQAPRRAPDRNADIPAPQGPKEQREALNARLDQLQDAANAASRHARNVYLTFLLFGLYLSIIFGSTTHEQLLRESPVTLPLLNVGLPLVGFYWVAPALFVLLHLNLLLELYLLSGKLHRLDLALGNAMARKLVDRRGVHDRRAQLDPFPFSQMLVGRQHGRLMRFLLWLVVWLTVLVLPVALLLMGQVQFLPYHDAWTTMWFRLMVAADILLILIFWRAIRHPADRLRRHPRRWLRHQAKVALPALVVLAFSFLVFTFPGDYASRNDPATRDIGDPMEEALLAEDGWLAWAYPASWRVEGRNARPGFWPTQALFDTLPFLQRNLVVREVNLVTSWPTQSQIEQFGEDVAWQNFGAPPSLRSRDLRYADLSHSIAVRGDFRDANLQGTSLGLANLHGANLLNATLQGADLFGANLEGARLGGVQFQGASLWAANLRGSDLGGANLQGANLLHADLRGAFLHGANLQSALLHGADLVGAVLFSTNVQGADLHNTDLRGADLRNAALQGAVLKGADLQGVDLRAARLWRALLDDGEGAARWALADLRGINIEPIDNLDASIEEATQGIAGQGRRDRVAERLWAALQNDDRPEVPRVPTVRLSAPTVMFDLRDSLPQLLGWGARAWATDAAYDEELAALLEELACGDNGAILVAHGLADRVRRDRDRLYAKRLAARLIGDDCPAGRPLPQDVRRQLEQLAAEK